MLAITAPYQPYLCRTISYTTAVAGYGFTIGAAMGAAHPKGVWTGLWVEWGTFRSKGAYDPYRLTTQIAGTPGPYFDLWCEPKLSVLRAGQRPGRKSS